MFGRAQAAVNMASCLLRRGVFHRIDYQVPPKTFKMDNASCAGQLTAMGRQIAELNQHMSIVKNHAELERLVAGKYTDPDNARLTRLLRKHRDSVLPFLDHDFVDATNNLAEREGRPAVIARKLSAGNRTEGRHYLDTALRWRVEHQNTDMVRFDQVSFEILRREAEALLRIPAPPGDSVSGSPGQSSCAWDASETCQVGGA
jgi:hypothetical protein